MIRILHTTHSYAPEISGVAEVVGQISRRLARRGYEVHVATGTNKFSPREEYLHGVQVHRFAVWGNAVTGIYGDVADYVGFVQAGKWDLITMHCAQTWSTDALLPHLNQISARKVFVGHGFSTLYDAKYQEYFVELAESLRQVDGIVALSDLLEEVAFCAKHGLPEPQIIPNGVDLVEWEGTPQSVRRKWGIDDRFWLLSVSNHSPVKGHKTFFKIAQRLNNDMPNVFATIIGGHYPAAKWDLGRFGIRGGCWYRCKIIASFRSNIELRLDLPRSEVVSAIQEADIVLITSWREASPLIAIESMAGGTPWISFNVGCVQEHRGGFVVKDLDEMVEKTKILISNPGLRTELGELGKQRVRERHSWNFIVSEYEDLYNNLMKNRTK